MPQTFICQHCSRTRSMSDRLWMPGVGLICKHCCDELWVVCPRCNNLCRREQLNIFGGVKLCHECQYQLRHWAPKPNPISFATYRRIQSTRKFGVELESDTNQDHILAKLQHNTLFGVKADPTVQGKEFYSPVLYGDQGLEEVEKLCGIAYDLGWRVANSCGYHLHLDMRDETEPELRTIAFAFTVCYDVFRLCVESHRHNGSSYCRYRIHPNDFEHIHNFVDWSRQQGRYNFLNVYAYHYHGTFENRLHEGTFDPEKVCNWVILNLRIADTAKQYTIPQLKSLLVVDKTTEDRWTVIKRWLNDDDIARFYENRMQSHPLNVIVDDIPF